MATWCKQHPSQLNRAFFSASCNGVLGNFGVQSISSNGSGCLTFLSPADICEIISASLIVVPSPGAAESGRDIDLHSNYCCIGEPYNTNAESDVASVYDWTGLGNVVTKIDIATVLSLVKRGHMCGIEVTHNVIGGSGADYLGIEIIYMDEAGECRNANINRRW